MADLSAIRGLAIRRVSVDSLHLDPSNARVHGEENMAAIEGSLRRFGQAEPIVVQKASGRIIGGNGRLVAMRKLGWKECDVVELDIQATALGIALNRSGELATWDDGTLAKLLEELRSERCSSSWRAGPIASGAGVLYRHGFTASPFVWPARQGPTFNVRRR
jgi:ParB-like chromosome segregation protein Spo0J